MTWGWAAFSSKLPVKGGGGNARRISEQCSWFGSPGRTRQGLQHHHGVGLLFVISGLGKKNHCSGNNKLVWLPQNPLFAHHRMWAMAHCRATGLSLLAVNSQLGFAALSEVLCQPEGLDLGDLGVNRKSFFAILVFFLTNMDYSPMSSCVWGLAEISRATSVENKRLLNWSSE